MALNEPPGGGASPTTDPASSGMDVSLREFFSAVREGDLRTVWMMGAALVGFGAFAWAQVQRRLEILNHENERLLEQKKRTVSADTYVANEAQRKEEQGEYKKWKEDVDRDRTGAVTREEFQQDNRAQRRGAFASGTSAVGVAASLVVMLLLLLTYIAARHVPPVTPPTATITVPSK